MIIFLILLVNIFSLYEMRDNITYSQFQKLCSENINKALTVLEDDPGSLPPFNILTCNRCRMKIFKLSPVRPSQIKAYIEDNGDYIQDFTFDIEEFIIECDCSFQTTMTVIRSLLLAYATGKENIIESCLHFVPFKPGELKWNMIDLMLRCHPRDLIQAIIPGLTSKPEGIGSHDIVNASITNHLRGTQNNDKRDFVMGTSHFTRIGLNKKFTCDGNPIFVEICNCFAENKLFQVASIALVERSGLFSCENPGYSFGLDKFPLKCFEDFARVSEHL